MKNVKKRQILDGIGRMLVLERGKGTSMHSCRLSILLDLDFILLVMKWKTWNFVTFTTSLENSYFISYVYNFNIEALEFHAYLKISYKFHFRNAPTISFFFTKVLLKLIHVKFFTLNSRYSPCRMKSKNHKLKLENK